MNPSKSIRADAVIDREGPVYVLDANDRVRRVTHAQKQDDGKVLVVYAGKSFDEMSPDVHLFLASPGQIQAHEDERDRLRVADALRALGDRIVRDRLPVPVSLARVTVGFDLDDEQDLSGWAKALGRDPVKPDFPFDPVIESTEFGVRVQLLGGRREVDVERTDSVGAFPITGEDPRGLLGAVEHSDAVGAFRAGESTCAEPPWGDNLGCPENADNLHHCRAAPRYCRGRQHWCKCGAMVVSGKPKPAPDGWPVSDGHRPKVSDDAMQHDGRYDNGRAEA